MGSGRSKASRPRLARSRTCADLLVGSGVVVAGADEPAAVVVVYGDLVGFADEPAEDVAGFAELVAEVGRYAGRRGGAFGWRGGFGGDLLA